MGRLGSVLPFFLWKSWVLYSLVWGNIPLDVLKFRILIRQTKGFQPKELMHIEVVAGGLIIQILGAHERRIVHFTIMLRFLVKRWDSHLKLLSGTDCLSIRIEFSASIRIASKRKIEVQNVAYKPTCAFWCISLTVWPWDNSESKQLITSDGLRYPPQYVSAIVLR